jgi:hypothetical protein
VPASAYSERAGREIRRRTSLDTTAPMLDEMHAFKLPGHVGNPPAALATRAGAPARSSSASGRDRYAADSSSSSPGSSAARSHSPRCAVRSTVVTGRSSTASPRPRQRSTPPPASASPSTAAGAEAGGRWRQRHGRGHGELGRPVALRARIVGAARAGAGRSAASAQVASVSASGPKTAAPDGGCRTTRRLEKSPTPHCPALVSQNDSRSARRPRKSPGTGS